VLRPVPRRALDRASDSANSTAINRLTQHLGVGQRMLRSVGSDSIRTDHALELFACQGIEAPAGVHDQAVSSATIIAGAMLPRASCFWPSIREGRPNRGFERGCDTAARRHSAWHPAAHARLPVSEARSVRFFSRGMDHLAERIEKAASRLM